jgi:hypothetical protein
VDAAQGMPVSDTVATLLYNGGSLPDLQGADQVLFTGQSTSADEEFAQWSAVSALPDQAYPACGVTAQQYWDSGDDWHTRLARVCGPSTVTMPDVTGGTAGAAGSTLQAAFLGTGPQTLTTACPPSQNHLVISTVPAPGAATAIGWQTPLTVCNLDVSVPGVLTFGDGAARNAIAAAGLTVGAVTMAPSCTQARGSVLTQDPGEGTQVIRGSAVSLTESTGKQPNGKTCPIA